MQTQSFNATVRLQMAKGLTNRGYAIHNPVIPCFRQLGRAPQIRLEELASTGDKGQILSEER
jgi:hypothetical protein